MSRADVMHHYQERDDEPPAVTIPEKITPGQMYMVSIGHGLWDVYGWAPGECHACRGAGKILERDTGEPTRLCLNCRGTGSDHDEPEVVAAGLYEFDAQFVAFGRELLATAAQLVEEWDAQRAIDNEKIGAPPLTHFQERLATKIGRVRESLAKFRTEQPAAAEPAPSPAAREPEPADLADDASLPPAVRAILGRGRESLAKFRAEQEAEEEQREREESERVAAMLEPAKAVVRQHVPAELLPFVNWKEGEYRGKREDNFHNYAAELAVPGCWAISVQVSDYAVESGVWRLYKGFWTWSWDDERQQPTNNTDAIPDFAEALAVARECWVRNETRRRTVPL